MYCGRKWGPNIQELWFHTTSGLLYYLETVLNNEFSEKIVLYILYTKLTPQSSLIFITCPNFPSGYPYLYPCWHHSPKEKGTEIGVPSLHFHFPHLTFYQLPCAQAVPSLYWRCCWAPRSAVSLLPVLCSSPSCAHSDSNGLYLRLSSES